MMGNSSDNGEQQGAAKAARGTLALYIQGLVSGFAALAFTMLITRILDKTDVGVIYTITTFTTILTTLGSIAVFNTTTRFIADALGRNDKYHAGSIATTTIILGFLMSLIMGFVVLILLPFAFLAFQVSLPSGFPWVALAIDVLSSCFLGYLVSVLQGGRKYSLQAGSIVLVVSLKYSLGSIFLILGGSIVDAVIGWAIGSSIGIFCVTLLTIKQFRPVAKGSILDLKRMLIFSAPLFLSMLVGQLNANFDKVVLLAATDVSALGVYSVGLSVSAFLMIAGTSLYNVALTEQSIAGGRGFENLKEVSNSAFRYVFLVYTPFAVVLSLFSIPIVSVLFTAAYVDSFVVVVAIGFTRSVLCYDLVANGFLLALNNPRALLQGSILAFVIQIIPALVLIAPLGIAGAAISRCTLIASLSLYPLAVLRKSHGFIPDLRFQARILVASYFPVLPSFLILENLSPLFGIPLAVCVYGLLYLLGLRTISTVTRRDIETIVSLLPKKFQLPVYRVAVKTIMKSG